MTSVPTIRMTVCSPDSISNEELGRHVRDMVLRVRKASVAGSPVIVDVDLHVSPVDGIANHYDMHLAALGLLASSAVHLSETDEGKEQRELILQCLEDTKGKCFPNMVISQMLNRLDIHFV